MANAAALTISTPTREEIPCPVCDARDYQLVYAPLQQIDDPKLLYGVDTGARDAQTIVCCRRCGMQYENPRFPESAIIEGYQAAAAPEHDSQHALRTQTFYRALERLSPYLPPSGGSLLDVGSAGGAFLEAAERYGYEAFGLEPSGFLVKQAVARGLKVEEGTARNNPYKARHFDLISMWDVLEHVNEPRQTLEHLTAMLKPGGIMLINYPDVGTWMAKIFGRKLWWYMSPHINYFDRSSITEICRRAGLNVFYCKAHWQTLEFGHLLRMASHLGFGWANYVERLTPSFIKKIPFSYTASQTTVLARKS